MAEKVMFDYQKLTQHELRVLDLMGERSSWTILELSNKLMEVKAMKNEDRYRDFLKQRPHLFGMYVHTFLQIAEIFLG